MATPLSADQLVRALRGEGLRVVEHRSWRTHNRNHIGPWGPVNGVMIHHTVTSGTASSVELCYNGHSSLPGPLCHGVIAKDGTVYLVGNGRANHAGLGDDDVLRAVVDETSPLPADDEANTDGNRHFYGFECINLGDGKDPWPAVQLAAIEKAAAAICRAHGWSHRSVIGHLEWQPGKVDPRGFGMDWIRGLIKDRLGRPAGSAPTPIPSEEDDMPLSDEDLDRIALRVNGYRNKTQDAASVAAGKGHIPDVYAMQQGTYGSARALVAQVAALTTTVTALAQGGGLDAAEIQAAAEAGARAALAELGDALTN
ncbi:N-acetylmuramoyl-L-alanine amidase [Streptomyces sp. NPDC018833]|uniref:N-acetylmuramoyl-L-alanine amidase n=1 Tax=Streptomyces sp. NPDC018833 TaxID=3365053 RepID=UPI0037B26675